MAEKAWKRDERKAARLLGGTRTAVPGGRTGRTRADVAHPELFVECKRRKRHSVLDWWREAAHRARDEGKTPVLVLTEQGQPGAWLVVHSCDWPHVRGVVVPENVSDEGGSS